MVMNWIARIFGSGEMGADGRGSEPASWPTDPEVDARSLGAVIDPPEQLQMELERARRHERDLSVVVLGIRPSAQDADPGSRASARPREPAPQMRSMLAVAALRGMLRQTDVLCYQPAHDRFVLALAECTTREAGCALERIAGTLQRRLALDVRAGIARFPDDALTLADLVAAAVRSTPEERVDASAADTGLDGARPREERRASVQMRPAPNGNDRSPLAVNGTGSRPGDGRSADGHDA